MIVADTSAVLALLDAHDRQHEAVRALFEETAREWVLPSAILPEVDYLARKLLGPRVARLFLGDVARGTFVIEPHATRDVQRALALDEQYAALNLGLVDGMVAAVAERLGARAIATFDVRHFGALELKGAPVLLPGDR